MGALELFFDVFSTARGGAGESELRYDTHRGWMFTMLSGLNPS